MSVLARDTGWEFVAADAAVDVDVAVAVAVDADSDADADVELEACRAPVLGRSRDRCVRAGVIGSFLAVMSGLLDGDAVTRRRAIRCVVAIVPARCWACQPSIRGESSSASILMVKVKDV